ARRFRPQGGPGRHLGDDQLRQPWLRDRRYLPGARDPGGDGRGPPELHGARGPPALRRGGDRRGRARDGPAPGRSRARRDARHLPGRPAPPDDRALDAALRPAEEAPVREPHVRADLPGLSPGLYLLRRAAHERAQVRYRPVDEVIHEIENCGSRMISINDADFFGTAERPKQVMRALKGRGVTWQAGVTSKLAQDDRMLELAAASGCSMLSIGFESISRSTLTSVHKHVNRPETFAALVEKVHSFGIMVFGLFMFGFDGDAPSLFAETANFNISSKYDACAYSALTPYPGTLTWYEMKKANRIVSFDWSMYDQGHVVYRPAQMSADELRIGLGDAYENFYSTSSIAGRFPLRGKRHRAQWLIYNLFMRKASQTQNINSIPAPTAEPDFAPMPPLLPLKREWRAAVLEAAREPESRPG